MKVIVIGSSHAGYEALEEMLQSGKDYQLQWYEQGDYLSFMSWGMHLYLEGTVKDVDTIRYSSADSMRKRGVEVFPETELLEVLPAEHAIRVRDLKSGEERKENYDKLILGIGMAPNKLPLPGLDLDRVELFGGRDQAVLLEKYEHNSEIENVVILGGGYIALEAAMCFNKAGKKVTMLNKAERLIDTHLDKELTDILTAEIEQQGIKFLANVNVTELVGEDGKVKTVKTEQGDFPADLVLTCVGNHPNTQILKGTLDMDERGFIKVDEYQETSAKDVFAAGGSTQMIFNPIDGKLNIDLATNARKQGRVAAKNLEEKHFPYTGMQGTSALKVYDYSFASTGLTAKAAERMKVNFGEVYLETLALDEYLPEELNAKVYAKLVYNKDNKRVIGAQILSKHDLTGLIQAVSMAIKGKLTYEDIAFGDFFFQPLFNRPWNVMNELGLKAMAQEA